MRILHQFVVNNPQASVKVLTCRGLRGESVLPPARGDRAKRMRLVWRVA